jgi:hypothetical protein
MTASISRSLCSVGEDEFLEAFARTEQVVKAYKEL